MSAPATPRQLEVLLSFMDENPEFAKNYLPNTTQGRRTKNKLWADLVAKLNSIGLPNKSLDAWKKVWTDFKYRAKKKLSDNLLSIRKTGGGPSEEIHISDLEEKAIELVSLRATVEGSSSNSYGAPEYLASEEEKSNVEEHFSFTPNTESLKQNKEPEKRKRKLDTSNETKPKRSTNKDPKVELLKEQMEAERKFQDDVIALSRERNKDSKDFHKRVINLLEERNEIAAQQLEFNKENLLFA